MSSDSAQSSPPEPAPLYPQDRSRPPERRLLFGILIWAWIAFWLFGFVVYIVSLVNGTLSVGLSLFGIGIAVVAELPALFFGDVFRWRTRWRLRRRVGRRPSEAEVREELWRARNSRRGAVAKIDTTLQRAGESVAERTVGTVGQVLRSGKGAASTVGAKIDQVHEGRSAERLRRGEDVEKQAAEAAAGALQRYKNQRPGVVVDDTQIQFRSYTSQAAYRDDGLGLVAAGWYEQADPTLRYTIARNGFIVIMWRRSLWQRPVNP